MITVLDYAPTARDNEAVFRAILKDLVEHRDDRPIGNLIPKDLNLGLPLEELLEMLSAGARYNKFTIYDFRRTAPGRAVIGFGKASPLGGEAQLVYDVREDNSVEYKSSLGAGYTF